MSKFKVEFYKANDGYKPAKDFVLSQDTKMRAKLFYLIDILEDYGPELRLPYSGPLGDGILNCDVYKETILQEYCISFTTEGE